MNKITWQTHHWRSHVAHGHGRRAEHLVVRQPGSQRSVLELGEHAKESGRRQRSRGDGVRGQHRRRGKDDLNSARIKQDVGEGNAASFLSAMQDGTAWAHLHALHVQSRASYAPKRQVVLGSKTFGDLCHGHVAPVAKIEVSLKHDQAFGAADSISRRWSRSMGFGGCPVLRVAKRPDLDVVPTQGCPGYGL